MMRKFFAATLAATLILSAIPISVQAAPVADDAIVQIKKKKPIVIKSKQVAEVATLKKRVVVLRKTVGSQQLQADATVAHLSGSACGSFLQCVFGSRHRNANVQQASFTPLQKAGLSGHTTNRVVEWSETKYPIGSLIVKTPERALYYVSGDGEAIRYAVGVGREGKQWSGSSTIVAKAEWPSWTPPKVMIEREALKGHIIPPFMEGGPGNPLGARAMYIGGRLYRVHGTNNEASIGGAVSSGCIRMMNADVIDLYNRVKIGAKIYVYQ